MNKLIDVLDMYLDDNPHYDYYVIRRDIDGMRHYLTVDGKWYPNVFGYAVVTFDYKNMQ